MLAIRLDAVRLAPLSYAAVDTESLKTMRTELERWLAEASVPDHDARDVVLASWEAGANAIEHAQAPEGSSFHLDAVLAGDRIRVVADEGRWKEPSPRENRGPGCG